MTINVAVKCPDGIVMGSDSLVTLATDDYRSITSIIPFYSKLFSVGRFSAGAMLNGDGSVAGRTVEDIIAEFGEEHMREQHPYNFSLYDLVLHLAEKIQKLIDSQSVKKTPLLEIIIGGYSKGKKAEGSRFGEIYSLLWDNRSDSPFTIKSRYSKDIEFGTHYGGQLLSLDRFLYGIDDRMINIMLSRKKKVFNQVSNYILDELRKMNVAIPENIKIREPGAEGFDIFKLFSNYEPDNSSSGRLGETLKNIKSGRIGKLETMEKFFSLQTAVNYCSFLMSCAYAESAFTFVIPNVGSEMRVASVTRDEGFKFRRVWEIQAPGPPFR